MAEEEREVEAQRLALDEAEQPFDLAHGPLLRVKLLRLAPQDHILVFNMHHIISDRWSVGVLVRECSTIYRHFVIGQPSPLPELDIQYADFSSWQRELMGGPLLEKQLAYWKGQLANITTLELPTDRPRSALHTFRAASVAFNPPKELTHKLKALGRQHGSTLYMVLLAAFQLLLHRWSGQHDITVGSSIAGRRRTETETLIGFFINSLVLRTDLSGAPTFTALLRRVKKTTMEAYAHQDIPFEKLVEELSPQRDPSRPPFFQILFLLQNTPATDLYLGDKTTVEPFEIATAAVKFDITVILQEKTEKMLGSFQYNTDLFNVDTITEMVQQYQILLANIVANPEQPICSYSLFSQDIYQRLLDDWNEMLEQKERGVEAGM